MIRKIIYVLAIACGAGFAVEDDFVNSMKQKADAYFQKTNRAKLELFFNQTVYAPGDTARFQASYLKAIDLKPITGKQVVHLGLFDQYGKKKLTRWFSIVNGAGAFEFVIPESFAPGNYVLVAFTDWMKNMDQSLFFRQEFDIAGKNRISKLPPRDTIEFYPEGGQLISGIENNVAVFYTGSQTKVSVPLKESGRELVTLQLMKDSVTTVKFTPSASSEYSAELAGKKFGMSLAQSSGIGTQLDATSEKLKLSLTRSSTTAGKDLYILVFNSSGLLFQNPIDFGNDLKKEILLSQIIAPGVIQIAIADSKYNLIASRVAYVARGHAYTASFSNTSTYATRQPVTVDFQIKNSEGFGSPGTLSARVLNESLFQTNRTSLDYLTFGSDISSTHELRSKHPSLATINNFLITETCPWFDWKKMISQELTPQYKPQEYLMMAGKATYAKGGLPVRDSTLLMFYLEKNLSGYETYALNKGQFSFPLVLNASNSDRFFYTASFKGNDTEEILVKTSDPDSLISFKAKPTMVAEDADPYFIYRSQRTAINGSYAFFTNPKALADSTFDPNKAVEEELNGADATVRLTDFLQMPSMEEVLKEIVKAVEYRKINGRHVVRVYTTGKRPNNHTGPLYVIDGQLTKNPEILLSIKPSEITTIKLVKDSRKLFALGKLGANGVLLVNTKKHIRIQERSMLDFSGLLPTDRSVPTTAKAHIPDFRSCMLWLPNVRLNANGSAQLQFTTSDDTGKYVIQIQGITESGIPFYAEQPLEVKYGGN